MIKTESVSFYLIRDWILSGLFFPIYTLDRANLLLIYSSRIDATDAADYLSDIYQTRICFFTINKLICEERKTGRSKWRWIDRLEIRPTHIFCYVTGVVIIIIIIITMKIAFTTVIKTSKQEFIFSQEKQMFTPICAEDLNFEWRFTHNLLK